MNKQVLQAILVLSIFITSCNKDESGEQPEYWLNKNSSSVQYPLDSSYLQKGTILSGKLESLLKFESVLNNTKKKDTALTKENLDSIANLLAKSLDISENEKPYVILDKKSLPTDKTKNLPISTPQPL